MTHTPKMVTYDILFNLLPNFDTLMDGPKMTRLNKIYILTRKYFLTEVNLKLIWINNLGNILLENMDDSQVLFTMFTNTISSN